MELYSYYPSVEDVDDETIVIANDKFKEGDEVKVIVYPTNGRILTLKVMKVKQIILLNNNGENIDISKDHVGLSLNNINYLTEDNKIPFTSVLLSVFKTNKGDLS